MVFVPIALVAGCVALLNGGVEPEGDCGVNTMYQGVRYDPPRTTGALRQPRGLLVVGDAEQIACDKVIGHDAVSAIAGVPPEVAVVVDGYLLVRRGVTAPPRLVRLMERPIPCTGPTSFLGTWNGTHQTTSAEMPNTNEDGSNVRPYRLEVEASSGDHAAFQSWQRLQVTVAVTAETDLSRDDEQAAKYERTPILVATHCEGGRFVADLINLAPGGSADDTGSHDGLPDENTERIVSSFIQRLQSSFGQKVWLAVDWETSTILIGVAAPMPEELEELDRTSVAGLRVDVFLAEVTVDEYEDFIRAVGRTSFPGKGKVCSFNLPKEATFVEVNVHRLSHMSRDAAEALRAELETLTDARFVLVEAQQWHWLTYPPEEATSDGC